MEIINPATLHPARGYHHGIKASGTYLFIAGQTAWDKDCNLVGEGDLVRQIDQALENLAAVLREAGGGPEHLAKLNVYVLDMEDFRAHGREIGQVYQKHLGDYLTPSTLVQVGRLYDKGFLVEIEGIAVL
ncbi:MAG TPA: RidA family protein [Dehalococcoidia bacterium]|nr:RidA family protein [Dehalococcoidia bacterium]HLB29885.1 RidA family protein [Dehalococcoidia bacterium]